MEKIYPINPVPKPCPTCGITPRPMRSWTNPEWEMNCGCRNATGWTEEEAERNYRAKAEGA